MKHIETALDEALRLERLEKLMNVSLWTAFDALPLPTGIGSDSYRGAPCPIHANGDILGCVECWSDENDSLRISCGTQPGDPITRQIHIQPPKSAE